MILLVLTTLALAGEMCVVVHPSAAMGSASLQFGAAPWGPEAVAGGYALDPGGSNCGEALATGVRVVLMMPDGDVHEGVGEVPSAGTTWLVVRPRGPALLLEAVPEKRARKTLARTFKRRQAGASR